MLKYWTLYKNVRASQNPMTDQYSLSKAVREKPSYSFDYSGEWKAEMVRSVSQQMKLTYCWLHLFSLYENFFWVFEITHLATSAITLSYRFLSPLLFRLSEHLDSSFWHSQNQSSALPVLFAPNKTCSTFREALERRQPSQSMSDNMEGSFIKIQY